ncbi:MAG: tripartite tricarboxylate transporter TctB family protein [Mesorhizobium sp.]
MLKSIPRTDLVAGLLAVVVGIVALVEAWNYPFGTTRNMGPGYFPIVLSVLLIIFGLGIAFLEGGSSKTADAEDDPDGRFDKAHIRPLLANMAAFLALGSMIESFGLFISATIAVMLAGLADKRVPVWKTAILAVIVAAASCLIFVYGLRLQIKVLP